MAGPIDPGDAARTERLADIILVLQRCFMQRLSEQLAHGQVSFAQYFLLTHVAADANLTMSGIAEKMNHSTAAATGLVDRLENLGYVKRSSAEGDRRKVLVHITRKGGRLVERIREDIIGNLREFMHELSPNERATWLVIYEKIFAYCTATKPLETPKP